MTTFEAAADIEVPEGFDPEAEIAREVLAEDLGDSFSREDEEYHARAWELTNGRPLKRDWHSWADWRRYKKNFKSARPAQDYSMDKASAAAALQRLLDQTEWSAQDQAEIAKLCGVLGREVIDTEKLQKARETDQADALKRLEKIQSHELWIDRAAAVAKETHLATLYLVASRDTREEVRTAASERIAILSIAAS